MKNILSGIIYGLLVIYVLYLVYISNHVGAGIIIILIGIMFILFNSDKIISFEVSSKKLKVELEKSEKLNKELKEVLYNSGKATKMLLEKINYPFAVISKSNKKLIEQDLIKSLKNVGISENKIQEFMDIKFEEIIEKEIK